MTMRRLAYLAIASGALLFVLVLALPWLAEYSYATALRRYGAEELAATVAREELTGRWVGILVTLSLATAAIVSGFLMLRRRPSGSRLWLAVCALFVLYSLVDFAIAGVAPAAVLRLLWWGSVMLVSVLVMRKQSAAWFGGEGNAI